MSARSSEAGLLDWLPIVSKIDWSRTRRPPTVDDKSLSLATEGWLERLPYGVRPRQLQLRFARIANKLAAQWSNESLIRECFTELLENQRAFRQGFPPIVEEEIRALAAFRGVDEPETVSFDDFLQAELALEATHPG